MILNSVAFLKYETGVSPVVTLKDFFTSILNLKKTSATQTDNYTLISGFDNYYFISIIY